MPWVLLTNGIEWRLYHLTFNEGEGIAHDLAFEANLLDELASDPEGLWAKLGLLTRAVDEEGRAGGLLAAEEGAEPRRPSSGCSSTRTCSASFAACCRKDADAMLDIEDVFKAVRDVLSKEALADAGDLGITKRRKRRRKVQRTDAATGQTVTEEVEEDDDPEEGPPAAIASGIVAAAPAGAAGIPPEPVPAAAAPVGGSKA